MILSVSNLVQAQLRASSVLGCAPSRIWGQLRIIKMPLLLGVGWLSAGVMEGGEQPDFLSLIIYQSSLALFTWWQKSSKRESGSLPGLLKSKLRTDAMSFTPHTISQNKSQSQSRFKKWRNIFHLLIQGAAKTPCKEAYLQEGIDNCGYFCNLTQGWRNHLTQSLCFTVTPNLEIGWFVKCYTTVKWRHFSWVCS